MLLSRRGSRRCERDIARIGRIFGRGRLSTSRTTISRTCGTSAFINCGAEGAAFADICNRRGDQYFGWGDVLEANLTPGTQIGLTFYRHYLYTQDKDFLRNTAYPFMKACSLFYLSQLKREADGTYYLP